MATTGLGVTVRIRTVAAVVAALAAITALGVYVASRDWTGRLPVPRAGKECTVQADGRVTLDSSQMANAATIAAVGIRRGVPERGVVVALSAALQESKLENLSGGDRDSVGLFQQRPSQGWGTPDQLRDPRYAAGRFYSALTKVRGWEHLRVTEAAQAVQRSAYPEAYERWADESRVLTMALAGRATGAVACTVIGEPALRGVAAATALSEGLLLDWGATPTADVLSLAMSVADAGAGWRYAHWLVSHATDRGVERVRFAGLEWTASKGVWTPITADRSTGGGQVVAEVFGER
jgi:hypothetical protein